MARKGKTSQNKMKRRDRYFF